MQSFDTKSIIVQEDFNVVGTIKYLLHSMSTTNQALYLASGVAIPMLSYAYFSNGVSAIRLAYGVWILLLALWVIN
jgi:hypothetical protein